MTIGTLPTKDKCPIYCIRSKFILGYRLKRLFKRALCKSRVSIEKRLVGQNEIDRHVFSVQIIVVLLDHITTRKNILDLTALVRLHFFGDRRHNRI